VSKTEIDNLAKPVDQTTRGETMKTQATMTQRWNHRRDSFRPAGELITPGDYGVELVDEKTAKAFVLEHHYSGSYPASRCRVGLYRRRSALGGIGRDLVGVAIFSVPMNPRTLPKWTGQPSGCELGRFVLLDDVPGNGETWFLARAFKLLRQAKPDLKAVVSYSDPVPRATPSGRVVMPGHVGTIYQAHNGVYHGRGKARTLIKCGQQVVSDRALSKLRNGERGDGHVYDRLVELGAPTRNAGEGAREYVKRALSTPAFTRERHPGNHVYTWSLTKRLKITPATDRPYPKQPDAPRIAA
jgi:hypothetical protein